jgi:CRISPR type I-E-associated protein CasB/Cse2
MPDADAIDTDATEPDTSDFIGFLQKLYRTESRGPLAHLRQSAHDPTNAQVFQIVGDHLPGGIGQRETDAHLVVGSLFALYVQSFVAEQNRPRGQLRNHWASIGASARLLRRSLSVGQESLDQRVTALINSHQDDLPNRLRHMIQRFESEGIEVDFEVLLSDLLGWRNHPRRIRRRWAEDYWQAPSSDGEDS